MMWDLPLLQIYSNTFRSGALQSFVSTKTELPVVFIFGLHLVNGEVVKVPVMSSGDGKGS